MASVRDRALIVKVARMYYEQNFSQDQIARELITSRSNISRILSAAKEKGIVEIRIVEASQRDTELEALLVARFGIRAAYVAYCPADSNEYKAVGTLAASNFSSNLKPNIRIAVSWGRSVQAMVQEIKEDHRPDVTLIPIMGGMTDIPSSINGETLIQTMASKLQAEGLLMHAPAIVQSPEMRNALMLEPSIRGVIDSAKNADRAYVGIGSRLATSSNYILQAAGVTRDDNPKFFQDMVGDIAGRFYDKDGRSVDPQLERRTVGLTIAEIQKIKHVVGVAAGEDKASGILGALRGKLISELVTSSNCALKVLEMAESTDSGME
ncbi:MAG: sugar-binding transcriptional regulator [Aquiluna sp.]|nr:sugar-binding transcriptional regulator [Aquiluna sp.]MCF8545582.1 sugar-binding transcriptional regulator [Aquiluna sp.]